MDPVLTPFRVKCAGIRRSDIGCLMHIICLAAFDRAMYSTFVVEVATDLRSVLFES